MNKKFKDFGWDDMSRQIYFLQPLESIHLRSHLNGEFSMNNSIKLIRLFFSIAAFILLIACINTMNLSSARAAKRMKEIGIRKVIGASVTRIMFLLSTGFTKWIILANLISWPIAYYAMYRWLQNFAYRININIWIFIFSGTLALFIALLTLSYQTIKAATANPVDSLRYE
jgi:putative ABC transport system permease protein